MDDFGVPRTPKCRHNLRSSQQIGIHVDEKNVTSIAVDQSRSPRKLELIHKSPRGKLETCHISHDSNQPLFMPGFVQPEATRFAGIVPRLRNKYLGSAATESPHNSTTALLCDQDQGQSASVLPRTSDTLQSSALSAPHAPSAATSLKSTFLKMFSSSSSGGSTITESRSTSRHCRYLPTSRSNSRLDDRIDLQSFLDDDGDFLHSSDKALSDAAKEPFLKTTKSITNLFRARTPTPAPTPSLATNGGSFYFDKRNHEVKEYPDSAISEDTIDVAGIDQAQGNTSNQACQPSEVEHRLRRSLGSVASYSARDLRPLYSTSRSDDVQALTADTYVEPSYSSHNKPMNFSRPARAQQTAAREAMEMESWTARFVELEETMSAFHDMMLELEQMVKSQQASKSHAGVMARANEVSHKLAIEPTPPLSHPSRTSDEHSTTSWLEEDMSEPESAPGTRPSSPELAVMKTPSTIVKHSKQHDLDQPTQPNFSSAQSEQSYSPTAKVYKMFVATQNDMNSLRQALDKLRADAPARLRLPSTQPSHKGSKSTLNPTDDEDPFILSVKTQSSTSPCAFTSYASSNGHSTHRSPRSSAHSHRHDSYLYSESDSCDDAGSPQRPSQRRKRSSAVVGTATKAMQVLGAQQVDIDAHPPRSSSKVSELRKREY